MLPRLIKKQMPNLIGLDISTASIKLIELGLKPDGYRVEHYAMVPLPHGVIEDEIKDPASVIHCVKKAIEESQTSIQSVAIAVPDFLVVKKIFQFPMSLKKEEIKNYIELEAEKIMKQSLDKISMDFQILGPSVSHVNVVDVLFVGLLDEHVNMKITLLKKAGLIPKIVDIESYAMERAIHFLGHEFEKLEIRQSDGEIFYRDLKAWMISFGLALRQFDGERDEFNSY